MQNYTLKDLISKVFIEISDHIKLEPSLSTISKAESEEEVYSMLRDRIFRTDAKTKKFLDGIKAQFATVASAPAASAPKSLSEAGFSQILHEALDKLFQKKDSQYKLAHHYFSPEQDLVVSLKDNMGNLNDFRVLAVKTN